MSITNVVAVTHDPGRHLHVQASQGGATQILKNEIRFQRYFRKNIKPRTGRPAANHRTTGAGTGTIRPQTRGQELVRRRAAAADAPQVQPSRDATARHPRHAAAGRDAPLLQARAGACRAPARGARGAVQRSGDATPRHPRDAAAGRDAPLLQARAGARRAPA